VVINGHILKIATVSGGFKNSASGIASAILGGTDNSTNNFACAMIIGSNIIANRACTTFEIFQLQV
jgi:hypothetical protein